MKKEELKKLVGTNLKYVKDIYQHEDGFQLMFVLHVTKDKKSKQVMCMLSPEAIEQRHTVIKDLGFTVGIAVKNKEIDTVDAIFMMSEAWMSKASTKEGNSERDKKMISGELRPSEDPNHLECLVSIGMVDSGETYADMYEIKKTWVADKISVSFKSQNEAIGVTDKEAAKSPLKIEAPILDTFWNSFRVMMTSYEHLPKELKDMSRQIKFLQK